MARTLSTAELRQRRLRNQLITKTTFAKPGEAVRWMGAVQAQDYRAALWGVGLRTREADEQAIERAVAEREIVRTWPMRGTLHFVSPDDVRWMLELLTPRVVRAAASRYRQLELDDKVLARCERVIARHLQSNRQATRGQLYGALEAARIATGNNRGLHVLSYLAQRGVLCFGPRTGKQPTMVLLDEWLPNAKRMDGASAIVELTRRYFTSHGPATPHDLSWWSGLTLSEIRLGLEGAAAELVHEKLHNRTHWFAAASPSVAGRATAGAAGKAYMLPSYDEYTVAYRDRSAVLARQHLKRVNAGGGIFNPIVVIDGVVLATWKRTIDRGVVKIALSPFERFTRGQRLAIEAAAARYGTFIGADVELW